MANQEQLEILKKGVDAWNKWRQGNSEVEIDLSEAKLAEDLHWEPYIEGMDLSDVTSPSEVHLVGAALSGVNLSAANLNKVDLTCADLRKAILVGADLGDASLRGANLNGANLSRAKLWKTDLSEANLSDADLSGALLNNVDFSESNLIKAKLRDIQSIRVLFTLADLSKADLSKATLKWANLDQANLSETDLTGTDLSHSSLVGAEISNAKISESQIYGINIWDLKGEFKEQTELIISQGKSAITVDNIKVAQFVYLILNNKEIRDVINTLTSKTVLILGRFALPERKAILDALRNKLRQYDLLPIVFDFDRPTDKDFTETIKTLAGLSYFVIADVTNPKSSPLELQAIVPDYQIPFVPIIQEGESPFAMMVDLQKKYNWVLNTVSYDSEETLMKVLKPLIIDPAMKKRQELRIIKAQEPEIISAKDFLVKGKE